jgi:hypothetical protein
MSSYTPQTWVDGPAGNTPFSASRFNHIEQGIAALDAAALKPTDHNAARPATGFVLWTGGVLGAPPANAVAGDFWIPA